MSLFLLEFSHVRYLSRATNQSFDMLRADRGSGLDFDSPESGFLRIPEDHERGSFTQGLDD